MSDAPVDMMDVLKDIGAGIGHRRNFVAGLRELANFLESNPSVPISRYNTLSECVLEDDGATKEIFASFARLGGKVYKVADDKYFGLDKRFGNGALTYELFTRRERVCKRRVVGKREVEEKITPAHVEEIVEWDCMPILREALEEAVTS